MKKSIHEKQTFFTVLVVTMHFGWQKLLLVGKQLTWPLSDNMVCSHWVTLRMIYIARPMKWLKEANGISGRVSVQYEVFYILQWIPFLSFLASVSLSLSVSLSVKRPIGRLYFQTQIDNNILSSTYLPYITTASQMLHSNRVFDNKIKFAF